MASPMVDLESPERTAPEVGSTPTELTPMSGQGTSGKELVSAASAAAGGDGSGYAPLRARLETHPGSAVVKQLEVWEKELDVLEREEGLLMQGQWKLLREQMGSMMEGLAETKSQIAELKRGLRASTSEASRSQADLRETETRLTSALAWEREQRMTLGPELQDVVRKGLRDEANARKAWSQAQAAATAEINIKLEDYAKKVEDIEPIWRELEALRHFFDAEQQDRKMACKELAQQIRVLRDRVEEADADQKEGLRSLRELIDRTIDKTEENFQELHLQLEGLNNEVGERGNQQVEAVQARCRDLSEEVASRMADLNANFEKVATQRMGSQAGLEHRLEELVMKVDEESNQRQAFAQEVIESVEASREATSKALQAMGAELDRRFDEDDLGRSAEAGAQRGGGFADQLTLQEEMVLLRRRVEELETQNEALRGSKDQASELQLADLAREVQELKENASIKAVEAELKEVKSQAFQSPMSSVGATTTATLWDFSKNSARGAAAQTSPGRRCASPFPKCAGCQGCCLCLAPDAASPTLSARSKEAADAKACLLAFAKNIRPKKTSPRAFPSGSGADRAGAESVESDEGGSEVFRSRTQTGQSAGDSDLQADNRASVTSVPEGFYAGVGRSATEPTTVRAAQDLNEVMLNPVEMNRRQVGDNLATQYEKGCLGDNLAAAQRQVEGMAEPTPKDEEEAVEAPGHALEDVDRRRSTRSVGFTLDTSSDEEDEVLIASTPPPVQAVETVVVQEEEVPPVQIAEAFEVEEPVYKDDDPPIATRGFLSEDSSSDDGGEPVVVAAASVHEDPAPIDAEALQALEGGGYAAPVGEDEDEDEEDDEGGLPVNSVITTQSRKSVEPKKLDEAASVPKEDAAGVMVEEEEVDPVGDGISRLLSRPKEAVPTDAPEPETEALLPGAVEDQSGEADAPEGSDGEDSWSLGGGYAIKMEEAPATTEEDPENQPEPGDCLASELQDAHRSGSDLGSLQGSSLPPSHVSSRRSSGAMAVQGTVYDPNATNLSDLTPRSDQIDSALDRDLMFDGGLLIPEGVDSRRASGSPSVVDIQNATEAASLLGSQRSQHSASSAKTSPGRASQQGERKQEGEEDEKKEQEKKEEKKEEEEEEAERRLVAVAVAEEPVDASTNLTPGEVKTLTRQSPNDELQGEEVGRSYSDSRDESAPHSEGLISYPLVIESDEDLSPQPVEQSTLSEVLTSPQLGGSSISPAGRQDGSHRSSRQSSSVRGDCADNLGATFDPQRSSHEASPDSNVPSARLVPEEEPFPAFGEHFAEESSVSSGLESPPRSSRKAPPPRPQQVPALRLPPQPFSEQEEAAPSLTGAKSSSRVSQVEEYYLGSPAKPEAMVVYGHTARRTANGVYKPLARTYVDAPVYFCREANTYLFRSRNGCWGIGDRPSGGLIARVQSTAASAANITGTWKIQEESGAPWVDEPRMRLIPRKAFQSKLKESMVVVESHFIDVAGWYLRSTTRHCDVPVYFSTEANKTMWYTGSDWVISDLPGEGPCFANSVETTSKRPDTVLWFDANVYSPDLPDDLDLEDEENDGDADENEGTEEDEQGSVVELSHGYVDEEFWPDLHSLGAQPPELQVSGLSSRAFWVRALALRSGAKPAQVPAAQWSTWEIQPSKSLLRGAQGNCHVLAAMAVLAEYPTFFTKKVFNNLKAASTFGQYTVSLFDSAGRPKSIVIDDYVPCRPKNLYEKTAKPIFCQPTDNELQLLLAEKAMAKGCGSYLELSLLASNEGPGAIWRTLIGTVDQLRWRRELVGKGLAEWRCEVLRGANDDAEERHFADTKFIEKEYFPKVLEQPRFKANQAVNVLCRTSQRWLRDGVVAKVLKKRTEIDGISMPAGAVKVIYGKEGLAKWIPPMHFDLELKEANFMIGDDISVYGRTMGLWSAGKVQDTLSEAATVEGMDLPAGSVKVSYLSGKNVKWVPPHELADQLRAVRPYVPEAASEEDEEEKNPYMEVEEEAHDDATAMFHHIRRCLEIGFLVGASTNITEPEQRRGDGLIDCFPYPVLAAEKIDDMRLILIRNVWGAAHRWSGAWAAGSTEWQDHPSVWPALAAKFGGLEANVVGNGPAARSSVFVMQWEDFLEVFEGLHVSPSKLDEHPKAICQPKAKDLFASQVL